MAEPKALSFGKEGGKPSSPPTPQPAPGQIKFVTAAPVVAASLFDGGTRAISDQIIDGIKAKFPQFSLRDWNAVKRELNDLFPLTFQSATDWSSSILTAGAELVKSIADLSEAHQQLKVTENIDRAVQIMQSSGIKRFLHPKSGLVPLTSDLGLARQQLVVLVDGNLQTSDKLKAHMEQVAIRLAIIGVVVAMDHKVPDAVTQTLHNKHRVCTTSAQMLKMSQIQLETLMSTMIHQRDQLEQLTTVTIPTFLSSN